jgi:hypothetical protein
MSIPAICRSISPDVLRGARAGVGEVQRARPGARQGDQTLQVARREVVRHHQLGGPV